MVLVLLLLELLELLLLLLHSQVIEREQRVACGERGHAACATAANAKVAVGANHGVRWSPATRVGHRTTVATAKKVWASIHARWLLGVDLALRMVTEATPAAGAAEAVAWEQLVEVKSLLLLRMLRR
jgi:hypothetical protein